MSMDEAQRPQTGGIMVTNIAKVQLYDLCVCVLHFLVLPVPIKLIVPLHYYLYCGPSDIFLN